jgi:threonine synthase
MVAVQASGCAPIVRAFENGETHAARWENAHTIASGIRVPSAIGDFLILAAVRESGGYAMAVDDAEIEESLHDVAHNDGMLLCPEGAATHAAWRKSVREGRIDARDRVVLFNCASGLKYPLPAAEQRLDLNDTIDFTTL